MTVLKLALFDDVCSFDQGQGCVYSAKEHRKIKFDVTDQYAIILPIGTFTEGVGYSTHSDKESVIAASKNLSNSRILHNIIDTNGTRYARIDAEFGEQYLHEFIDKIEMKKEVK